MKMGTTPSLWRYDVGAYDTPLLAENAKAYDHALRSVTAMRARTSSHDVPNLRSRGSPRNGGSTAISGPISRSQGSSPMGQIRSSSCVGADGRSSSGIGKTQRAE